jgi:hypothetical protein
VVVISLIFRPGSWTQKAATVAAGSAPGKAERIAAW